MNRPGARDMRPGRGTSTGGAMAADDGKAQMGETPVNVTVWYDYI